MRLIDADKAIEKAECYNWDTTAINNAPTADAMPIRRAHWIWKGDEGDSRFMCSACGGKEHVPTCMGVPNIWEYCPNCGAKMDLPRRKRVIKDEEANYIF